MSTLPEPNFIDRDPQAITAEMVASYEAMTGKTLQPAQVERLIVDLFAYRESLVRIGIQEAAKQNLVAFARAPMLDYLGELVGVYRLAEKTARADVRVVFAQPLATALEIPAGTRFEASGIQFQSTGKQVVAVGSVEVDVPVEAVESGVTGNGFLAGQINALVDDLGVDVASVANIGMTFGGSEAESDDRLRERIRLAPEAFTVAGSFGAYRHHALSAHQDIVDVAVMGPDLILADGLLVSRNDIPPGVVCLFPLAKTGLPPQVILDAVAVTCTADKVRPLTDLVEVRVPVEAPFAIVARLTLYRDQEAAPVLAAARAAADTYVAKQQAKLGRDVVPSQIVAALSVPGVYRVELESPANLIQVPMEGWAHCTGIDIQFAGGADG